MISMTGYSRHNFQIGKNSFSMIIKSLNSNKGLDISIKTPRCFTILDFDIKQLIAKKIIRGKVDFKIIENFKSNNLTINTKKLSEYVQIIKKNFPDSSSEVILGAALKLPDIFVADNFNITKSFKKNLLTQVLTGLNNLHVFREKEGKALRKVIIKYIKNIIKITTQLSRLEKPRLNKKKEKILKQIKMNHIECSPSRLESEMIFYFERNDITEERIRLEHHAKFFLEIINSEMIIGKKLIFLSQEILREINTIGSKANDFNIQKRVVLMKEEVEKIREQLQNIL